METLNIQYEPEFKSLPGRNIMKYAFREDTEVITYQFEMIANNRIPGLLKCEAVKIDGRAQLSFDITSLIPLKKLFERREISRKDFLILLKQIVSMLDTIEEYLLDCGGIIFDSRSIFINPQDLHMEFAYLPLKQMPQDLEALRNLLTNSIIHDIRFADEPYDNFIQKLIELLKNPDLKIIALKGYINDMEASDLSTVKNTGEAKKQNSMPEIAVPDSKPAIPEHKKAVPDRKKAISDRKQVIPDQPQIAGIQKMDKKPKMRYPQKSYIILLSAAAAFILFGAALCLTGTLAPGNPDFLLTLFGYLMVGGATFYLVYSKLFTLDKRAEGIAPHIPPRQMEYVNKSFAVPGTSCGDAREEAAFHKSFGAYAQKAENQDRTVMLDVGTLKYPSLRRTEGNAETIILTHFPFMIGRLEKQVDYLLKNPAVGKLHAEIKKTSEGYYITDMNSLNSTFVNGARLEPSRDYKLESGNRITFANEEFIFNEGRDESELSE